MVTRPRRVAVIPARGGSKRLPKKNILELAGRPMISWTIEAALESLAFDRVMVSTDDVEIAEVAESAGASVPFLRKHYADDESPASMATVDALRQLQNLGEHYDVVVQLMANCPLRRARDILAAVGSFDAQHARFQISCFAFGWMNPWWAFELEQGHKGRPLFPEAISSRSQDLPSLFCPTGAIWIAQTSALLTEQTFRTADCRYEPMSWRAAMDIDDVEDLEMATALLAMERTKPCM